jgi:UDP-glucuronate 4-epimerase
MKVLVTGVAGFIGMHVAQRLAGEAFDVVGLDNINSYYDTGLKYKRLAQLGIERESILYNTKVDGIKNIQFIELDLTDAGNLISLFSKEKFDIVVNLAAQAGVRYSITNPRDYIESNIIGFFNILEACRSFPVKHLVYASSSSVYGNNSEVPFSTSQKTDSPVSLYAATKKSNELMAFTYNHLYKIPATGLRFFTVYGPWGRPDMAYFSFANDILNERKIKLFNGGQLHRDFTYIDDIVESITLIIEKRNTYQDFGHKVFNIGNRSPVLISDFLKILEFQLGKKAIIENLPKQPGDVDITFANTQELEEIINYTPNTPIELGLSKFAIWFQNYHNK